MGDVRGAAPLPVPAVVGAPLGAEGSEAPAGILSPTANRLEVLVIPARRCEELRGDPAFRAVLEEWSLGTRTASDGHGSTRFADGPAVRIAPSCQG
jgi:hypothetical protein